MYLMFSSRGGGRQAFTLMELLACIAIIGVLFAVSFVGIRQAVQTSRSSVCLGQLRQLGIAIGQYAAENRGATPGQNWFYPSAEANAGTRGTLAPYLGAPVRWTDYSRSVLTCPAMQAQFPSRELAQRTYTLNGLCVSRDETTGEPLSPLTGANQPRTLRLVESSNPGRQVVFFDGLPNVQNQASGEWSYLARGFSSDAASYGRFVHANMANAVFLDGHCEQIPRERFVSFPATDIFWTGR